MAWAVPPDSEMWSTTAVARSLLGREQVPPGKEHAGQLTIDQCSATCRSAMAFQSQSIPNPGAFEG